MQSTIVSDIKKDTYINKTKHLTISFLENIQSDFKKANKFKKEILDFALSLRFNDFVEIRYFLETFAKSQKWKYRLWVYEILALFHNNIKIELLE